MTYWQDYCNTFWNNEIPSAPLNKEINDHYGDIHLHTSYTMFVYGIDDPWQGAEMTSFPDPDYAINNHLEIIVADCEACAHCIDLSGSSEFNPSGLQSAHAQIKRNLYNWLNDLEAEEMAQQKFLSE
jgi:hypothetical protein